jgi:hypothetical protein
VLMLAERRAAGQPVAAQLRLPRLRPRLRRAEG